MARALSELRAAVRRLLGEDSESFFKTTEINAHLNEAQRVWCRETRGYRRSDTVSLTAGTSRYAKPTGFMGIVSVTYPDTSGVERPLRTGMYERQDHENVTWRGDSGRPAEWYQSKETGYFLVHPNPDAAAATDDLTVYGPALPSAEMSDDAHTPEIPDEYHDALVPMAAARCKQADEQYGAAFAIGGEFGAVVKKARIESSEDDETELTIFSQSMARDRAYRDGY